MMLRCIEKRRLRDAVNLGLKDEKNLLTIWSRKLGVCIWKIRKR